MTRSNGIRNVFVRSRFSVKHTKSLSQIYEETPEFQEEESPYSGSKLLNDKIHLHTCDITDLEIDAIVCSTQTDLSLEPIGICKRVWSVGGEKLRDACTAIQHCNAGTAFLTKGYELPANYVIHTAGPPPDAELSYSERKLCLKQSYLSCLQIVEQRADIKSVAFPCIGSGGAGIMTSTAMDIAVETLREWLTKNNNVSKIEHIIFCMYDNYQLELFCPKLRHVFPFPSERKKEQPVIRPRSVSSLDEDSQPPSTNILCYKYMNKDLSSHANINAKLSYLVETLKHTFSTPSSQVTDEEKFTEIDLLKIQHILRLRHSQALQMFEFRLFNIAPNSDTVNQIICSEVVKVIENFLVDHFSPLTDFKTFLRCGRSYMGESRRGAFLMDKLLLKSRATGNVEIRCEHPLRKLSHYFRPGELLLSWKASRFCKSERAESSRIPVEHDSRQVVPPDSLTPCYPSLPPLTMPGPDYNVNERGYVDELSWTDTDSSGGAIKVLGKSNKTEPFNDSGDIKVDIKVDTRKQYNSGSDETSLKATCATNIPNIDIQSCESIDAEKNASNIHIKGQSEIAEFDKTEKRENIELKDETGFHHIANASGSNMSQLKYRFGCNMTRGQSGQIRTDVDDNQYNQAALAGAQRTSIFSQKHDTVGDKDNSDRLTVISNDSGASLCSSGTSLPDCPGSPGIDDTFVKPIAVDSVSEYDADIGLINEELSDKKLLKIARKLGNKHKELGIELGLADYDIQACQVNGEGNLNMFGLHILKKWRTMDGKEASLETLYAAMDNCDIDTYNLRHQTSLCKK